MLYTFKLIDGRQVSYPGQTISQAWCQANACHPYAVTTFGQQAQPCQCEEKHANQKCIEGYLTCAKCGGTLGVSTK